MLTLLTHSVMPVLAVIAIIVFGFGLIVNFFIHGTLIFKIAAFCYQNNNLNQYWPTFFKAGFKGKALISSLIATVLAGIVFLFLVPVVLFRFDRSKKQVRKMLDNGYYLQYTDFTPDRPDRTFEHNAHLVGLADLETSQISGKLRIDALLIIAAVEKACKAQGRSCSFEVMKEIKLRNGDKVTIPVLFTIDGKQVPAYPLYHDQHIQQFHSVEPALLADRFDTVLYFSQQPYYEAMVAEAV